MGGGVSGVWFDMEGWSFCDCFVLFVVFVFLEGFGWGVVRVLGGMELVGWDWLLCLGCFRW